VKKIYERLKLRFYWKLNYDEYFKEMISPLERKIIKEMEL